MSKLESKRFNDKLPRFYYFSIVSLVLLICLASYYYYKEEERNFIQDKQDDLGAIADLKVNQITQWRRERLSDANFIFSNNEIGQLLKSQAEKNIGAQHSQKIPSWMSAMFANRHYEHMVIMDAHRKVVLSLPDDSVCLNTFLPIFLDSAQTTQRIYFSDIHIGEKSKPEIDIVVPLIDSSVNLPAILGYVILEINPANFLFPLIQSWPTPSKTSETVLFKREGNEIVFLNKLRHVSNEAMSMRFPLTRTTLPAVRVVLGERGMIQGKDYRDVPVLTSAKVISGTGWYLIAKIDEEELFTPMREELYRIIVTGGLFVLLAVLMLLILSRQQRMKYYFSLYQNESEKNLLLQKYEFLQNMQMIVCS